MDSKEFAKEKKKGKGASTSLSEDAERRVPELAENMEHTLRRLVREKERKRAKNPGLYK